MKTQTDKTTENKTQPDVQESTQTPDGGDFSFQFVDNRSAAIAQMKLQEIANKSVLAKQGPQLQASPDDPASGPTTREIHKTAARGVQGMGSQLPHFNRIQQSFGSHSISHVQAYTGSSAAHASRSIGAEAYATGNKVAFVTPSPTLHTAAHEAAHIVQQQAGVQLSGGIGAVGDKYERHADAVADRVVQGQSAEGLLSSFTGIPTTPDNLHEGTPRLNMLASESGRGAPVLQRLRVGMVPAVPNDWRYYTTTLATQGGTRGGARFSGVQRGNVIANNIAHAGAIGIPALGVGLAATYPASDSTKSALLTATQANQLAPQVDHIIEARDGGANDFDNARVLSQGENNGSIALVVGRPARTDRRMRAYQDITIERDMNAPAYVPLKDTINRGTNFTVAQIKSLALFAGVGYPAQYAAITNAMIYGIINEGIGNNNHVTVS